MKKKNAIITISVLSVLLIATVSFAVSQIVKEDEPKPNYYANKLTSPYIPDKLTFAGENVPLEVYWVHEGLDREMIINCYQHSKTLRIFKLSARVFPVVERILKEEGVPEDFKYLCVAESALENVTSPANAGGYWQFIPSTARKFGLTVTDDIDERCNLEKATRAACKYLKSCKNQFGSWTLAAAAYNRGEGGLQNAIEHQKVNNYWDLWLNAETSRYVYRILAFKLLFENPQLYGVEICPAEMYQPVPCKDYKAEKTIPDLVEFAKEQGATYKEIRDLNPWIKNTRLYVPDGKSYTLKIPVSSKTEYKVLFKTVENPYLKIGCDGKKDSVQAK